MFDTHQPIIEAWAKNSPERTAHVAKFVLTSIRCHFEQIPRRLEKSLRGDMNELSPASRSGFTYVDNVDITRSSYPYDYDLLEWYCQIPGLAIVKSGFLVQLLHGKAGCLDVHNLRIYGLDAKTFAKPAKAEALRQRCQLYANTCHRLGGTEYLWNRWCKEIARLRPNKWDDAEHVSSAHVEFILETYEGK